MLVNKLNVEDQVLPEDLEEANRLMAWGSYCIAQINYCIETQDNKGTRHWSLDHQRAGNDLKFLQFKKLDSERKMKNE